MLASQVPGWIGPGAGTSGPFCMLGDVAAFRDDLRWAGEDGRIVHDLGLGAIPTPPPRRGAAGRRVALPGLVPR